MNTLNTIGSSSDGRESEDALKVLGRVADAFDNPTLHKTDKEVLFVVNVVKSRRLLTSLSSEESVCQDTTYDSSFDWSCDEDVELVELGDVSIWERASSYPYASKRCQSHGPRSFSERIFRQGDGMYDVTKMLLTSSPLDRLDRLARMELKKTGWFERTCVLPPPQAVSRFTEFNCSDKWAVVEMGLQGVPLPITPPKTPPKNATFRVRENRERFSSPLLSTKTTSPTGEKQTLGSPRRPETDGRQSPSRRNAHPGSQPVPR
ncbi:hypothetical protein J3R83DRAFT_11386 [Lanmaoa asiatica]|nr:hypothetical protein J3R83DRAFT_11386 [Lanmaoa asiatica]